MATTHPCSTLRCPPNLSLSVSHRHNLQWMCSYSFSLLQPNPASISSKRKGVHVKAMNNDMLGDFGARDPFPAEIESRFADKVLGNAGTEHRILIPTLSEFSLAQQTCGPLLPSQSPMAKEDAKKLLRKILGWRLVDSDGGLRLQCNWKLKDFGSGVELINRISRVAEASGHYPNLQLEKSNEVRAELWSSSIGGLSMNDFILAAKIDAIKTSDLFPKKRIWA